jgi:ribulose-5-phosphate 4-epimerase/fuculose-1-phosphate aldolase
MHCNVYREQPDVQVVVHTHSLSATAAGSIKGVTQIPAIEIETVFYLGGNIDIVPFAPPGSPELANAVRNTIGTKAGIILANHGAIGVGSDMDNALLSCDVVEKTAELFCRIKSIGEVSLMTADFLESASKNSRINRGIEKPE